MRRVQIIVGVGFMTPPPHFPSAPEFRAASRLQATPGFCFLLPSPAGRPLQPHPAEFSLLRCPNPRMPGSAFLQRRASLPRDTGGIVYHPNAALRSGGLPALGSQPQSLSQKLELGARRLVPAAQALRVRLT